MKICPQCNAHYEDSMFFCLEDGSTLNSTSGSMQSNPATFEKTLTLPTEETKIDFPVTDEKTLNLPAEVSTFQKASETEAWQGLTSPPAPLPFDQTEPALNNSVVTESVVTENVSGSRELKSKDKGLFIILGAVFGGIVLLASAFGGIWFWQRYSSNQVALANVNKQTENLNVNSTSANVNTSNLSNNNSEDNSNISQDNSNLSNSNANYSENINSNKATPKTSPTKEKSPTLTPSQTPGQTPTPAPTSTPAPTPTPTRRPPEVVNGGVLNGKALFIYQPRYPPAAKAAGASGAVNVQVLIDENGNVIRANAVNGHPLLRASAEQAARSSRFSPPVVGGQSVKITGIIVYNFRL